jgi:hypothetical protein
MTSFSLELVLTMAVDCRNLEILTLGHGFLSDGFFYLLAGCESLQSLSITDATLGSGGAQEIQLRHESLRSLQIVKCRVLRIAIRFVLCPKYSNCLGRVSLFVMASFLEHKFVCVNIQAG